MTEKQAKLICKWMIENSSRPLADSDKETLKQAVERSKNWEELIAVVMVSLAV